MTRGHVGCRVLRRFRTPLPFSEQTAAAIGRRQGRWQTAMAAPTPGKLKVLFCGVEFPQAYDASKALLERDPDIEAHFVPREEIPERVGEFGVLVPRMARIDAATIARAKRLRLIVQFGVGLEGVDLEAATSAGVPVARIPSAATGNAASCAEHCIYLMLALLRNQHEMAASVAARKLGEPVGQMLLGKNVLLVGYGGIGQELAPRLKPFGVRVTAVRRSWGGGGGGRAAKLILGEDSEPIDSEDTDERAAACKLAAAGRGAGGPPPGGGGEEFLDERGESADLLRHVAAADIVVMCCLLTPETRGMVNETFLAAMKQGAFLVNIARGGLLDYGAVRAALESGHLGGLGADVAWHEPFDPDDPVARHPRVVLTPHVGGVTFTSYSRMAQIVNETVQELKSGKPLTKVEFATAVR